MSDQNNVVKIPATERNNFSGPEWAMQWDLPQFQDQGDRAPKLRQILPLPDIDLGCKTLPSNPVQMIAREYYRRILFYRQIENFLNYRQGRIIARDPDCYKRFGETRIYLWQSVISQSETKLGSNSSSDCFVPYLQILRGQQPIIYWLWLEYPITTKESYGYLL